MDVITKNFIGSKNQIRFLLCGGFSTAKGGEK
jgi:hypothetical protein